jgi:hypothetical protein
MKKVTRGRLRIDCTSHFLPTVLRFDGHTLH